METRSYLDHRYMRDRAMFLHDPEFCQHLANELVDVQARLNEFEGRRDTYVKDLGVPELTETELQDLGLDQPPSPTLWLGRSGEA